MVVESLEQGGAVRGRRRRSLCPESELSAERATANAEDSNEMASSSEVLSDFYLAATIQK